MSRRMIKQYSLGQIRRIRADLATLFPPGKVGSPEDLEVIYQELKRRQSPLAEAMLVLQQVQTALRKDGKGRSMEDVDKVIVWAGNESSDFDPEMQIEFRQRIGQKRKYTAISSAAS